MNLKEEHLSIGPMLVGLNLKIASKGRKGREPVK
jgi:hypothetical protein